MPKFDLRFEEGQQIYDDAIADAQEELVRIGLPPPGRPSESTGELGVLPEMPTSLSDMSPRELSDLLALFSRWFEYATGQLNDAKGARNISSKKRELAWSNIRKKKTGTVSDKDDGARADERFIRVDAEFEYSDMMLGMLTGIVRSIERNIETISRAITVMGQRLSVEGVGAAASSRRYSGGEARRKFRRAGEKT